jgi:hypothetical protein
VVMCLPGICQPLVRQNAGYLSLESGQDSCHRPVRLIVTKQARTACVDITDYAVLPGIDDRNLVGVVLSDIEGILRPIQSHPEGIAIELNAGNENPLGGRRNVDYIDLAVTVGGDVRDELIAPDLLVITALPSALLVLHALKDHSERIGATRLGSSI